MKSVDDGFALPIVRAYPSSAMWQPSLQNCYDETLALGSLIFVQRYRTVIKERTASVEAVRSLNGFGLPLPVSVYPFPADVSSVEFFAERSVG